MEDCRDLNADQLYAVMYGAVQKLITENDSKADKIISLESRLTEQSEQLSVQSSRFTEQSEQLMEVLLRLVVLESKS